MKRILTIVLLLISLSIKAQTVTKDTVIYIDHNSEDELYKIKTEGWIIMNYEDQEYLLNFSNSDYLLFFNINCKTESTEPRFLLEYTENYRPGYQGIDFTSSDDDEFTKIDFIVDGKEMGNPFNNYDVARFEDFKSSLKKGDKMIMRFYTNHGVEGAEDELDRQIEFKLANGQLLEHSTDCF